MLSFRSIIKTVSENLKKKNILEQSAFVDRQICKNLRPVTFLLYDMDIQLILQFKNSFGKFSPVCPKTPERAFLGHPVDIFI